MSDLQRRIANLESNLRSFEGAPETAVRMAQELRDLWARATALKLIAVASSP